MADLNFFIIFCDKHSLYPFKEEYILDFMNERPTLEFSLFIEIAKHKTNVEVYMKNAVGVGEHTDILESIGKEINHIGKYVEQIEVLEKIIKKD